MLLQQIHQQVLVNLLVFALDSPEYTLDVRGPVSTGTTALYVQGDARITGDLFVDDITFDDANDAGPHGH